MSIHKIALSKLVLIFLGIFAFSTNIPASDMRQVLVFDRVEIDSAVSKKVTKPRFISNLRASASPQFSADELPNILNSIQVRRQDIWIIDLRQESHGFIDGFSVSWFADYNWANAGKTPRQIQLTEAKLLKEISKQKTVTVFHLKKLPMGKIAIDRPVTLLPELVETEQQLVTSLGAQYERIHVMDHNKPDDLAVDKFVYFVKNRVKAKNWLHFHCRGGRGRATTFLAMYDIINNAHKVSFNEIIQRQMQIGGTNLKPLPLAKDKLWKVKLAKERYEFLKKFYAYVLDPNGYQVKTWSVWKNQIK